MAKIKQKTHSGAKKRFRATANGYKCRRANRGHMFTKRSTNMKRRLRANGIIDKTNVEAVSRLLRDE
jgi:large subunit ribosomal protein L35